VAYDRQGGVAVFSVAPGSHASRIGNDAERGQYLGPFPAPIAYGVEDPFLPRNLTDPEAGPVPPVSEWPTMNP
jgi:hypothetical protein